MQTINRIVVATITFLASAALHAFELRIHLVDEDNNPVADAVVEVRQRPISSPPVQNAVIDQINRRFVPMVIAVKEGQWVEFPNNDNVRHHVYSFSEIKQFSTELYADEPVDPVQFDTAGIAVLGCNIHDSMVAYVYVSQWQDIEVSDSSGNLDFGQLDTRPDKISVWHPWMDTPGNRMEVEVAHLVSGDTLLVEMPILQPDALFGFRALGRDR